MLRQMKNGGLFQLFASDLAIRLHNAKNLADIRKILARFKDSLGGYPHSSELVESFLAQYTEILNRHFVDTVQLNEPIRIWGRIT